MKRTAIGFVALIVVAFALGSCRGGAAVYNVESATMATSPTATLEGVAKSIKRAGVNLGWQVAEVSPGLIEAKLFLRSHVAIVDIAFDTKAFSIRYKDSTDLKYTGDTIHKNYNSWVQRLERAILVQTSAD